MKIGVYLEADWIATEGGGFSYVDKFYNAIDNYDFDKDIEIYFFTINSKPIEGLKHPVIYLNEEVRYTWKERLLMSMPFVRKIKTEEIQKGKQYTIDLKNRERLKSEDIRIVFYPIQCGQAIVNFPFIANNWDIGHCSTYAFPELVMNGSFEGREEYYKKTMPKALMVLAESETGRQELLRYVGLKDDKIKVLPIFAGDCIKEKVTEARQQEILQQHGLEDDKFFFYPAQFWAHKNHFGLVTAFAEFKKKHPDFKLVLTGSNKFNQPYIKAVVDSLGLTEDVLFLGFVDNEVINTMYMHATALTMATYFGPTNMPPLEAMHLGCPVICTDLGGHREELGDAAIYFEAKDPATINQAMEEIYTNRDSYKQKLAEQLKNNPFQIDNTMRLLNQYFKEAVAIRSAWGNEDWKA